MEETGAYIVFIVVISVLVVLGLGFITVDIFLLLRRRQTKMQAEMQDIKDNFQREMVKAREEASEEVMNGIARELHDNIIQRLTLSVVEIGHAQQVHPNLSDELQKTVENLRDTSQELRQLSHMLSGDLLKTLDLRTILQRMKENIERSGIIAADFEMDAEESIINKSTELFVLRILQELVNNSVKHSKATLLKARIEQQNGQLKFYFEDNGRGFDPEKINPGMGLMNIQKRLELLNATWKINTAPEKGFTFEAQIPLEHGED